MNASTDQREPTERASLRAARLSGEGAPERVLLAPWGTVETTQGEFILDEESVQSAVSAFERHGTDLPIDFEHQTLGGVYASPSGQAPAAGWIKRLVGERGTGLFAEIEWTQQGRALVSGRQYRYLSPVAHIRKSDRKLVAIHSAALTNKPAIVGMRPIVNRQHAENSTRAAEFSPPESPEIREIPPARTLAPAEARGSDAHPFEALRVELNLSPEAEADEVLMAAGHRIFQLRQEEHRRRVSDRIQQALRAGKLVDAQRGWAEELAARDEASFEEWFRTAPVVVVPGATVPPWSRVGAEHRLQGVAARARAEFQGNPLLRRLTSEEAFVADALRSQVAS